MPDRLSVQLETLTRILSAIEEYVYSGELLPDGDYQLRFAGPCRDRFLGLSGDQAQEAVWVDYVCPEDLALFVGAHEEARATGELDIQYRLDGADGRRRWVRDRGRVHHVDDRMYLDGSVLDVTALVEAEQRLTEHVEDIEILAHVHRELTLSSDATTVKRAVCRAVRLLSGASGVGLYQLTGPDLVLVDTDGEVPCRAVIPTDQHSGTARAFRDGSRDFVPDAVLSPHLARPSPGGAAVSSVLFEPVQSAGKTIAVFTVVWASRVGALPPRVAALLPLLTTEVAVALERADLVERLSTAAHTDVVTGLPNRRALEALLPQELSRAAQSARPLCLAMLDLDHFKAYNDTFGHPAGDALLLEAGQVWRHALRSGDGLVRFGGEEFVIVLPDCGLAHAQQLLEGLQRQTPRAQTASIGVARWDGSEDGDHLLRRADDAMYAAKHAGRDQVRADATTELADRSTGDCASTIDDAVREALR